MNGGVVSLSKALTLFKAQNKCRKSLPVLLLYQLKSIKKGRFKGNEGVVQPYLSGSTTPSFPLKRPFLVCCAPSQQSRIVVSTGTLAERTDLLLGLPAKGRLASGTHRLLRRSGLHLERVDPQKNIAEIPEHSIVEVWFWQQKDIIKKLLSGEIDLGIVGFDKFSEYGQGNADLVLVHDDLGYADYPLSLAIPKYGIFENINSLEELAQMPEWTAEKPLRVATGFTYLGAKFMKENGLKYVTFSTADGALEAAPAIQKGIADAILDLVGFNTILEENNLKEIEGGMVLESQAVLVASRKGLIQKKGALDKTREVLEILEGHLRAVGHLYVTANMPPCTVEEVEKRLQEISGLQVHHIRPLFSERDGKVVVEFFEMAIIVPQVALLRAARHLRAFGCSEVHASELSYSFDEESPRWCELLRKLGL